MGKKGGANLNSLNSFKLNVCSFYAASHIFDDGAPISPINKDAMLTVNHHRRLYVIGDLHIS